MVSVQQHPSGLEAVLHHDEHLRVLPLEDLLLLGLVTRQGVEGESGHDDVVGSPGQLIARQLQLRGYNDQGSERQRRG